MSEYRDIRDFERRGRFGGQNYTVHVHFNEDAGRYVLTKVVFDTRPEVGVGDGFETLDEAFDMGDACARAVIQGKP